ncbi:hypothetical protein [Massilia horti]|uniref:Uncharacterized protein n=1 Tax=Massilia horti TaxID=2562153 RepID=A0A4Y9T4J0_9BURK|nr:hypothetical protein [Massilia horti]TFW35571.1 hypothetical protein E4O92_01915 [Massilia horti]
MFPTKRLQKITFSVLGLAASAAFYTHDVVAGTIQAPDRPALHRTNINHSDPEHAYALVSNGTSVSGNSADWKDIEAARRKLSGDFLWFRDGGKAYVVQDPQVLAKAKAAWAPLDRLSAQMDGYSQQMDKQGKVMDALGKEMASASGQMQFASMEEIGRRMKEAGKPMNALGKQMGELGKQMKEESRAADMVVRDLIRDVLEKGLAKPAPMQG